MFSESADGSGALMRYELSAEAAETDGTLEFGQEQQTDALWKLEVDQSLPLTLFRNSSGRTVVVLYLIDRKAHV